MTNLAVLQASKHSHLRVDHDPMIAPASLPRNTSIIYDEIEKAASEFPLAITKNFETGNFACVAIFGFKEGQNLYIDNNRWNTTYIPLNISRGPFAIGSQSYEDQHGNQKTEHITLIDLDDSRVQESLGSVLFHETGTPTPYLESILRVLSTLKDGVAKTQAFIEQLLNIDLITQAQLKIEFVDGTEHQVNGLYTIDRERLLRLPENTILELHHQGYLEKIYLLAHSFNKIQGIVHKINKQKANEF